MKKYLSIGGTIICFILGTLLSKYGISDSPEASVLEKAFSGWAIAMIIATLLFHLPIKKQRAKLVPTFLNNKNFVLKIMSLGVVSGLSWFTALSQMPGGISELLNQNIIFWAFLFGVVFLGERFSKFEIAALCVSFLGLVLISNLKGEVTPLGILSSIVFGISIALQSLVIKKYDKKVDAFALNFWRGWGLILTTFILLIMLGGFSGNLSVKTLASIGIAQFLGLFLGRSLFLKAHEDLPITTISVVMLAIPCGVLFGSVLLLGETISPQKIAGAALIMAGLFFFIRAKEKLPPI